MRKVVVSLIGVAVFLLAGGSAARPAGAQGLLCDFPTDFLTSGGFIVRPSGKANFGLDGGCKNGSLTGQLNYIDRSIGLQVSGTSITGYFFLGVDVGNARIICGTAGTNLFGDVDWAVQPADILEPGRDDVFFIRLTQGFVGDPPVLNIKYTTEEDDDVTLGGSGPGGGNVKVHRPQADFLVGSCAALGL